MTRDRSRRHRAYGQPLPGAGLQQLHARRLVPVRGEGVGFGVDPGGSGGVLGRGVKKDPILTPALPLKGRGSWRSVRVYVYCNLKGTGYFSFSLTEKVACPLYD